MKKQSVRKKLLRVSKSKNRRSSTKYSKRQAEFIHSTWRRMISHIS